MAKGILIAEFLQIALKSAIDFVLKVKLKTTKIQLTCRVQGMRPCIILDSGVCIIRVCVCVSRNGLLRGPPEPQFPFQRCDESIHLLISVGSWIQMNIWLVAVVGEKGAQQIGNARTFWKRCFLSSCQICLSWWWQLQNRGSRVQMAPQSRGPGLAGSLPWQSPRPAEVGPPRRAPAPTPAPTPARQGCGSRAWWQRRGACSAPTCATASSTRTT